MDYAPYQEVASKYPGISEEEFKSAVQFVDPDGKVTRAAEAVFRSLATAPLFRWTLWMYSYFPGARRLAESVYGHVAAHRSDRPEYTFSVSIFVRFIGLIYFIAFASLGVQILGLAGSGGIWPASEYLRAGLRPSDAVLKFLCWGGAAFSAFAVAGLLPAFFLILAWIFYLSLLYAGGPFLSFQWDILLLETGFLAVFISPAGFRARLFSATPGSSVPRIMLKVLLFKLMFLSGVVKLASGDAVWRDLSALQYHFETQPLPVWVSWYAHHLPAQLQSVLCFSVFVIELAVPFLIFLPRRARHLGASVLIAFQLAIAFTGNYTFFNLLTIALCLLLFEDAAWPGFIRSKIERDAVRKNRPWPRWIVYGAGILVLLAHFEIGSFLEPFRIANRYGLFAVMTTERREIEVQGSRDGKNWLAYEFKYKPGDPNRKPAFVAPHQPRLDWQMWFAALGNWRQNPWFVRFCRELLRGSPEVLALLHKNPFPDGPPRFVRANIYDYHFTSAKERRETGAWWRREHKGAYCPPVSLKDAANHDPEAAR